MADWRTVGSALAVAVDAGRQGGRVPDNMTTAIFTDLQQRIDTLTPAEKVELMEVLWRGLARDEATYEAPAWHAQALEESERLVMEGGATFSDWTEARERLNTRFQQRP